MDVLLQVGKDGELQGSGVDDEIVKFVCQRARRIQNKTKQKTNQTETNKTP